jgi:hypothetical protein
MKQHALPGYDDICEQLDYAAYRNMKFSAAYCQSLLETAEGYAQEVQALQKRNQMIEPLLVEIVAHLRIQIYISKEARQTLIERIEKVLKYD